MGAEVATSPSECRSLQLEPCSLTDSISCSGREVRTVVLRPAQPKRLCEYGPSFESSQRRSSLGYRYSYHIFTVSTRTILWKLPSFLQVQLYLVNAPCKPPDLTEPTLVGPPDIHIPFFETRCRPEALGMCQDHKIETKRNWYGERRRTARRRRGLSIDRREILHARRCLR